MDRYGYQWNGHLCIGCRGRRCGPERGRAARPDGHGGVDGRKPVIGAISANRGPANDGENARLRTLVRRAIIALIAHLLPAKIATNASRRPPAPAQTSRPVSPHPSPSCALPTRAWPHPCSRSSPTTPGASRAPAGRPFGRPDLCCDPQAKKLTEVMSRKSQPSDMRQPPRWL